jgi:hypothetical protein
MNYCAKYWVSWQLGTWDLLNSVVPNDLNDTTLKSHSHYLHDLPEGMVRVRLVSILITVRQQVSEI